MNTRFIRPSSRRLASLRAHIMANPSVKRAVQKVRPPPQQCFVLLEQQRRPATTYTPYTSNERIPDPTSQQLRNLFKTTAVPMVGFGFMDQALMIVAGNAIDCTLGVTLGLSTLTAAAFGAMVSNGAGVVFGSTLDTIFRRLGLPRSGLSSEQRGLPITKRTVFMGNLSGVLLGCTLGLTSLLFIDTNRSTVLKKENIGLDGKFHYQVEASNSLRNDATTVYLRGPDVDGLLACTTAVLSIRGYSVKELHAGRRDGNGGNKSGVSSDQLYEVEDIFVVARDGKQVPDEELGELMEAMLEVTRDPIVGNVQSLKKKLDELQEENDRLVLEKERMENLLDEKKSMAVSV